LHAQHPDAVQHYGSQERANDHQDAIQLCHRRVRGTSGWFRIASARLSNACACA
jgi:hypothetical protein